jgi:hypothetical protein
MRPAGLLRTVLWPFLIGCIVTAVIAGFGAIIHSSNVDDNSFERDILLFAKEGSVENDANLAIASEIKKAVSGQIDIENFSKELSASSSTTKALELMPAVKEIVGNPAAFEDLAPEKLDWMYFLNLMLTIFGVVSILFINVAFPMMSDDYNSNPDDRNVATFPWNKPWGIAVAPLLLPWLIISQPIWFVVWLVIRIKNGPGAEKPRAKAERLKKQEEDRERSFKEEAAGALKAKGKSQRAYFTLVSSSMKTQEEWLLGEIARGGKQLEDLAQRMEDTEREIARNEAELTRTRETILRRDNQGVSSINKEFDQICKIPGVKAVRVRGSIIEVWTERVIIKYGLSRYNIGMFKLDINVPHKDIRMTNRANTASGTSRQHPYADERGNFCFGTLSATITNFFEVGDYYSLVVTVLKAMHSAEGDSPGRVTNWKKANK